MGRRGNRRGYSPGNYQYSGTGGWARHQQAVTTYRLYEKLGPETRHLEYKEAQGAFMHLNLRETIGKYVCGFLNSEVEGTLMFGVTDNGEVIGINNSDEDRDRKAVDSAIRDLKPPVLPKDYSLQYCPVLDKDNKRIDNLSVVELTVFPKDNLTDLYETSKGECYMRRDASTEKMKPQQIQEWVKTRISSSRTNHEEDLQNLRQEIADKEEEVRNQHVELQIKENDVKNLQTKTERQEEEIERLQQEIKEQKEKTNENAEKADAAVHQELQDIKSILMQKKQSKVCSIS